MHGRVVIAATGREGSVGSPVRAAGCEHARPLSLVLSRAFREDPVHRWILPGEEDWALWSAGFFATVVREALRHEGVFTTSDLAGAALWQPPYPAPVPWRQRLSRVALWYAMLGRRASAVGRALAVMERARPLEPHWYLAVLGTDPRHQRRGVGSALLAPVLARCDVERLPAYLESSRRENVSFYRQQGFRNLGEVTLPGGPTLWRMQRDPRP